MTETQRRFLREIGARVGGHRVFEVRLFPAIRQGGIESGVAIVAARPAAPPPAPEMDIVATGDVETPIPLVQETGSDPITESDPGIEAVTPDVVVDRGVERYQILAARYKLVLKGPERGTWEMDVRHEADAPLDTIDRVVRGVAMRAGEEGEPDLIAQHLFREALSDAPFVSDADIGAEHGAG